MTNGPPGPWHRSGCRKVNNRNATGFEKMIFTCDVAMPPGIAPARGLSHGARVRPVDVRAGSGSGREFRCPSGLARAREATASYQTFMIDVGSKRRAGRAALAPTAGCRPQASRPPVGGQGHELWYRANTLVAIDRSADGATPSGALDDAPAAAPDCCSTASSAAQSRDA